MVGAGDIGIAAIAASGAPLKHLVCIDGPAGDWVDVVEALINAVDVVLLRPPAATAPSLARRIAARLRRGSARTALLVAGAWPAAPRLYVAQTRWSGLADGHGQLRERRATVAAAGRAVWVRETATELWLPADYGSAQPLEHSPATARRHLTLVGSPSTAA